jgi:glycosyltransferase involved in cell wall biosynthesis
MIRVLALSLYGSKAASHRVRFSQFQCGLAAEGIELNIQSLLDNSYLQRSFDGCRPSFRHVLYAYYRRYKVLRHAKTFDLAIVHCELLPFLPGWLERLLLQIPIIYDCDDAFYLRYRSGPYRLLGFILGGKADRLMAMSVAVTAGNTFLTDYASRFCSNVALLPSVVDTEHYRPSVLSSFQLVSAPFTIGWIGSPSTAHYLDLIVQPLEQLSLHLPVRLLVVGGSAPAISGVEVIQKIWSLEQEVQLIQQFDVGVMPLPDTPWSRGKCAYKLIQCMACGIPVVASCVGANVEVVGPNCGLLVQTPGEWLDAFMRLASDPALRQLLGQNARHMVQQRYSLKSALPILSTVIHNAISSNCS